ncbi:uncharacterized protein LOC62_04G006058 [Vanrija pseudolonga]|uniref:Uncharacterized protein n=1 Tax=Vanrija pseudolonga TaxID=143232 RepID=A0AAF1BLS8_9TREE|nr:hypothetical protein LOC62_04G006058 [Vanrija pseudolonga]
MSTKFEGKPITGPYARGWRAGAARYPIRTFHYIAYRRPESAETWFGGAVFLPLSGWDAHSRTFVRGITTVKGERITRPDAEVAAIGWNQYHDLKLGEERVFWPAYDRKLAALQHRRSNIWTSASDVPEPTAPVPVTDELKSTALWIAHARVKVVDDASPTETTPAEEDDFDKHDECDHLFWSEVQGIPS